jgi:hypothetical protein
VDRPRGCKASWASFSLLDTTAADIERTWITGRAIMPALSGLLLSMAVMTWQPPGPNLIGEARWPGFEALHRNRNRDVPRATRPLARGFRRGEAPSKTTLVRSTFDSCRADGIEGHSA